MINRLAVASVIALSASQAHAQSNVTFYGLINDGITRVSNVQSATKVGREGVDHTYLASSILAGSRWGVRGTEDMGGGLKALFLLEGGWDMNSGKLQQGGAFLGRQVYVGLSNSLGTFTIGRQYDILLDFVTITASNPWASGYTAHVNDLDNLSGTYRVNNSIKFRSQTYRGLTVGALYSLGETAGDAKRNRQFAVGVSYGSGPLYVASVYLLAHNPNISVYGNTPAGGDNTKNNIGATTPTGVQSNPAISGYASASSKDIFALGLRYKIGGGTLYSNFSKVRFSDLGDTSSGPNPFGYLGTAHFTTWEFDYTHAITDTLTLGGGFVFTKGRGPTGDEVEYRQPQISVNYLLSKRTDLYGVIVHQKASGRDSTGQAAVASITAATPSASRRQSAIHLGIRHLF